MPSKRGTDDLAAMFAAGRRGSGTKTATPVRLAPEPSPAPLEATTTPAQAKTVPKGAKAGPKGARAVRSPSVASSPPPPAGRIPAAVSGLAEPFRKAGRAYPHRLSLDVTTETADRLRDLAYQHGRLRHITLARHLLALAMESPETVAQAARLAREDLAASAESRRRS